MTEERKLKEYEREILELEFQLDSVMNRILRCLGIARKLQAALGYEQKSLKRWVAKRPYKKRKGE
jgi:hypothetical protein